MDKKQLDHYYFRAKQDGYVARSVYKLEEIDQKFKLIKKGYKVLDLGAAPGSWLQYIERRVGKKGFVLGLDMAALDPNLTLKNAQFIQCNIFKTEIDRLTPNGKYDLILSDIAPKTTGNKIKDQVDFLALIELVLDRLNQLLLDNGHFVFKFYQGSEFRTLFKQVRSVFEQVKTFKPKASRRESTELFVICQNYRPVVRVKYTQSA